MPFDGEWRQIRTRKSAKIRLGTVALLDYNITVPEEVAPTNKLDRQLADLPGVGTDRASQLTRMKCHTLGDLLLHRPRRHEDRRNIRPIRDLSTEDPSLSRGRITVMSRSVLN